MSSLATRLKKEVPTIVSVATNKEVHEMFKGKTFTQVVEEFGLEAEDVKILDVDYSGDAGQALGLSIKGIKYAIPFSKKFDENADVSYWANSRFYVSDKNVWKRDENNRIVRDEDGNLIPTGEKEPYMSFGRPGGMVVTGERDIFAEESAEDKTKAGVNAATRG